MCARLVLSKHFQRNVQANEAMSMAGKTEMLTTASQPKIDFLEEEDSDIPG